MHAVAFEKGLRRFEQLKYPARDCHFKTVNAGIGRA
jgi:hypothetical protein